MRHLNLRGLIPKRILTIASAMALIAVPTALAQRGGAHAGGGAGHFPGRVGGPPMGAQRTPIAPRPAPIPPPPRPVAPPRPITVSPPPRPITPVAPRAMPMPGTPWRPVPGFRAPGLRPQLIPPKRLPLPRPTLIRPVAPIFSYPIIFGQPPLFFGLGAGFNGWNALWWQGCGPFSLWYWGCNTTPFYGYRPGYGLGYSFGNSLSGSSTLYEPQPYEVPAYQPLYLYSGPQRDLVELYLKDGTVYNVTDYWVVNNELHFTMTEDGKSAEHTIPFDSLDLQKTIDVNTQRGFHFTLRNEPIEQYLQDHPEIGSSPGRTQIELAPAAPAEPQTAPGPAQTEPNPAP
ncbi:MAG: hypothetical protein ACRD40_03810 [Candidatus Acidiferrales bacterium]